MSGLCGSYCKARLHYSRISELQPQTLGTEDGNLRSLTLKSKNCGPLEINYRIWKNCGILEPQNPRIRISGLGVHLSWHLTDEENTAQGIEVICSTLWLVTVEQG